MSGVQVVGDPVHIKDQVPEGKTLVPTFEVVPDPVDEKPTKKTRKKATRKKATRKKVARKAKTEVPEKVTKKVTKKIAKKAKTAKTARQLGAAKAAALRHAPPKLRSAIKAKRTEIEKLGRKVKDCTKQLKALEKQL